jgi:hypothetical protein
MAAVAEVCAVSGAIPMMRHIGTRYTPLQALRIWLRSRRFAKLREDAEVTRWLEAIR